MTKAPPPQKLEKAKEDLDKLIKDSGLEAKVNVSTDKKGRKLTIRLENSLLFSPGSADLTPQAGELMKKFAEIMTKAGKPVRVEGHTDNIPIHNAQFQSNWQLSTARAGSVILELINKCGVTPTLLSASGYGEYRPVAPNDTPENRAKNRRVEFVITDEEEEEEGEGEGEQEGGAETEMAPEAVAETATETSPEMNAHPAGEIIVEPAPETSAPPVAPTEMLSVEPLPEAAAPVAQTPNP